GALTVRRSDSDISWRRHSRWGASFLLRAPVEPQGIRLEDLEIALLLRRREFRVDYSGFISRNCSFGHLETNSSENAFLFPVGSRFLASLGSCCQFLVQRKFESLRSMAGIS
ncbi:unnamed protein product, partial [Musa hybrid cultivar]